MTDDSRPHSSPRLGDSWSGHGAQGGDLHDGLASRASLLRTIVSHLRLTVRLLREPRVPLLAKAFPVLTALYVVSPLDFVPDFLPVVGQLDDLGMILLGVGVFLRVCPEAAVAFHRAAMAQGRR